MLKDLLRTRLFLDAGEGGSAGDAGDAGTGGGASDGGSTAGSSRSSQAAGDTNNADKGGKEKTSYTKEDLDAAVTKAIEDRMARESKAREKAIADGITKGLEEERRKAAMTEAEKLQAAKDEAEKKAAEREQAATAKERAAAVKLAKADAKTVALDANTDPKLVSDVLVLANIGEDHLDDNGEPDAKKIKASIDAVLKDRPFLLKGSTKERSGEDFGGGGGDVDLNSLSIEEYAKKRKEQMKQR